jgi:hypothetical protein
VSEERERDEGRGSSCTRQGSKTTAPPAFGAGEAGAEYGRRVERAAAGEALTPKELREAVVWFDAELLAADGEEDRERRRARARRALAWAEYAEEVMTGVARGGGAVQRAEGAAVTGDTYDGPAGGEGEGTGVARGGDAVHLPEGTATTKAIEGQEQRTEEDRWDKHQREVLRRVMLEMQHHHGREWAAGPEVMYDETTDSAAHIKGVMLRDWAAAKGEVDSQAGVWSRVNILRRRFCQGRQWQGLRCAGSVASRRCLRRTLCSRALSPPQCPPWQHWQWARQWRQRQRAPQ